MDRTTAAAILEALRNEQGADLSSHEFIRADDAFELLVLTILSAQTTDRNVNAVRDKLFSRYPTPAALAAASPADIERIIRPTGYYHAKTRHITGTARAIVRRFEGIVPCTMEELLTLPGVGRKTANIVLARGFGLCSGIAVDTHVGRVSRLLGISDSPSPLKVERDLMALYPPDAWGEINTRFIIHGRSTCIARRPRCEICCLQAYCRYYQDLQRTSTE
jgi:endonuclease-3